MQPCVRSELLPRLRFCPVLLRWFLATASALFVGTWGHAGPVAAPATSADHAGETAWLAQSFTTRQRDELREVWRWGIAEKFVAGGAMLIMHRGETVFREAFGVADLATGRPFTVDAPCRLASVTKPFTATLFARLVEEGRLAWDDPVDKFLPEFAALEVRGQGRAKRAPLIRELLSHTAGFPGNDERRAGAVDIPPESTLAEVAASLARAGLVRELAAYQSSDASYFEGYRGFVAPQWQASPKTSLRLRFEGGQRQYKGAPAGAPVGVPSRRDTLQMASLELQWQALRQLSLSATVQRDERRSNQPGAQYRARIVALSAQAGF